MRAQEFVTELFQPGKDWQWSFTGSEEAVAVFHVGEVPYMFHAYGADGEWEAEFKQHGSKLNRLQKFGLTGTGNSAQVMSTVVDIMRSFLEKYKDKIQVLTFSAKEDSRQGLYARMVKRLLPDWTMKQSGEHFVLVAPKTDLEENMDHSKDSRAVEELKAALLAKKDQLQSADDDQVYNIIDKIMTRIARSHSISGQKLHDMWVDKYKQIPDTWVMNENFADKKVKGKSRPGRVKRAGASCAGSVTDLRARAKRYGGEKGKMYHWCANMKSGRNK